MHNGNGGLARQELLQVAFVERDLRTNKTSTA